MSAPTPAAMNAPTPGAYSAPTPAPYNAPTPAAAPTPAPSWGAQWGAPTPQAMDAPTPARVLRSAYTRSLWCARDTSSKLARRRSTLRRLSPAEQALREYILRIGVEVHFSSLSQNQKVGQRGLHIEIRLHLSLLSNLALTRKWHQNHQVDS
jgi:hypothetical protein